MWRVLFLAAGLVSCAAREVDGRQAPLLSCPPAPAPAGAQGMPAARRCTVVTLTENSFLATVDGKKIEIRFQTGRLFQLKCCGPSADLEGEALPRFAVPQAVATVVLKNCAPPRDGSYAAALAALGIVAPEWIDRQTESVRGYGLLTIEGSRPEHFPAEAHHLDGLDALLRLNIDASASQQAPVLPPRLLAERLPALRVLRLSSVVLAPGALLTLPRAVRELHLNAVGVDTVPAAALARMPLLDSLLVVESGAAGAAVEMAGAPRLASLTVRAGRGPVNLVGPMPANLTSLEIRWRGDRPGTKWGAGGAGGAEGGELLSRLPDWLAQCPRLEELTVRGSLRALPADLLARHRALRVLVLSGCSLTSLPERLLHANGALQTLDLSRNALTDLPEQLLIAARRLQKLDLSHNRLGVSAADAVATGPAASLLELSLEGNPLGDLCVGGGSSDVIWADADSRLKNLVSLKKLILKGTGVNRICRDWRQTMENLETLELSGTKITQLTYSELQYKRKLQAKVYLKGVNLENVQYSPEDYDASRREPPNPLVTVITDATLECDCRQYWAALAFQNNFGSVRLQGLRCRFDDAETPFDFHAVPPDRLTCDAPELCPGLPAGCACLQRPDLRPPGSLVRYFCENASLDEVRRVNDSRDHAWALHLAHNRIAKLRAADLPPVLWEADLRSNNISRIDAATVAALLHDPAATLHIGGNAFDCGCGEHEGLASLQRAGKRVDFGEATCKGGGKLVVPARCAYVEWSAGSVALICFVLLAYTTATLVSRPEARLRLKVALARAGCLQLAESDPTLRFDAFVSYAHQDEDVVNKLAARLENGRAPLRLCLHERDWVPGGWIPTQIAASVRSSRCTVAVVSEHYVRSGWARAEFREAHAAALREARPHLVVVLLDEPSALPLDEELRDYLAANTYVRWGDPWFWEKLRVALCPAEDPSKDAAR